MDKSNKCLTKVSYNNIQAILLDFDGTIVPSEKIFLRSWQEVFMNNYACKFSELEYIKYELMNDTELINYLFSINRLSSYYNKEDLMNSVYEAYELNFNKMLHDMDFTNVLCYINEWKKNGKKLGIVSTSRRKYIDMFFSKYYDFRNMFSVILCREDVSKLKPDPMIYNIASSVLGVDNSKCLVIEDSPKGIRGAILAEMNVVRVVDNSFNVCSDNNVSTVNSITDIELF